MRKEKQMTDDRVFSGYTKVIDEERESWYRELDGEKLEWEDLAASKSTNDLLGKLHFVPLYEYLTKYLLYVWEGRTEKGTDCGGITDELVNRVRETFRQNGMPEEKCSEAHIREMLTTEWNRTWDGFDRAAAGRIFELGLGLGLPAEDVEELLQKAVKRAGFNYYNPEELLVYCALRFSEKKHYRCYQALLRDYMKVIPEESGKQEIYNGSTADVRDRMEEILERRVGKTGLYSTEECEPGTMNQELERFFAWHKAAVPDSRTAAVVFTELMQQFIGDHAQDILAFKQADRSTEEYAETVLRVKYDARCEIVLPSGSVFYAVKGREKRKVYFVLEEDEVLPRRETVEVVIPVEGTEEYAVSLSKKATPGYAGKGEALRPDPAAVNAGVLGACTATTLKYIGRAGEMKRAEGDICAVCRPGTEIPEGTLFSIGAYTYRTLKRCRADASRDIPVHSVTPSREGKIIAETGEVQYMEHKPEGILAVSNRKPVRRKKTTDKITKELFRDFLYVKDAQRLDASERRIDGNLIGLWFTETEITSVRFSNIQKQAGGAKTLKRNMMENSEVRRCDIITLAFLNFCMDTDEQPVEEYVMEADPEAVYQDFVVYVNRYLRRCGMMPFYLQNPYECMLAYLIQTDTPVDSLRNMWKIANAGKESADG